MSKKKAGKKIKIRVDPLAEYREVMEKSDMVKVMALSNDEVASNIRGRVSTSSLALDRKLRSKLQDGTMEKKGGLPYGRIIEIYGPPFIGKSSLLDGTLASVQRDGGVGLLYDTEVSRDRAYTSAIGVDIKKLQIHEMARASIESVMTSVAKSILWWKENHPDTPVVIGWDSLGKTPTEEEIEKFDKEIDHPEIIGEKPADGGIRYQPGSAARAMARVTRHLSPKLAGTKIALVIINHEYDAIESRPSHYKKKETYGGAALQYSSSVRLEIRYQQDGTIKNSAGWPIGREVVVRLAKDRLGWGGEASVPIFTGSGVNNLYTFFTSLKTAKMIVPNGSWSAIKINGEEYNFQGFDGLARLCAEKPELYALLMGVYEQVNP